MSHFYGVVRGARGEATRQGHKTSGLRTVAASCNGSVEVAIWYDEDAGVDRFSVTQEVWHGRGVRQEIATGVIGEEAPGS